jgi:hypothetical protein
MEPTNRTPGRQAWLTLSPMRLRRRSKNKRTTRRAASHWHLTEIANTGNISGAAKSDEIALPREPAAEE